MKYVKNLFCTEDNIPGLQEIDSSFYTETRRLKLKNWKCEADKINATWLNGILYVKGTHESKEVSSISGRLCKLLS